jgi:hypothetical protein
MASVAMIVLPGIEESTRYGIINVGRTKENVKRTSARILNTSTLKPVEVASSRFKTTPKSERESSPSLVVTSTSVLGHAVYIQFGNEKTDLDIFAISFVKGRRKSKKSYVLECPVCSMSIYITEEIKRPPLC